MSNGPVKKCSPPSSRLTPPGGVFEGSFQRNPKNCAQEPGNLFNSDYSALILRPYGTTMKVTLRPDSPFQDSVFVGLGDTMFSFFPEFGDAGTVTINGCTINRDSVPSCKSSTLPRSVEIFTSTGYVIHNGKVAPCTDDCFERMKASLVNFYKRESWMDLIKEVILDPSESRKEKESHMGLASGMHLEEAIPFFLDQMEQPGQEPIREALAAHAALIYLGLLPFSPPLRVQYGVKIRDGMKIRAGLEKTAHPWTQKLLRDLAEEEAKQIGGAEKTEQIGDAESTYVPHEWGLSPEDVEYYKSVIGNQDENPDEMLLQTDDPQALRDAFKAIRERKHKQFLARVISDRVIKEFGPLFHSPPQPPTIGWVGEQVGSLLMASGSAAHPEQFLHLGNTLYLFLLLLQGLQSEALRNKIGKWLEADYADTLTEYGGIFQRRGSGPVEFIFYPPAKWGSNFSYQGSFAFFRQLEQTSTLFPTHFHSLPGGESFVGPSPQGDVMQGDMWGHNQTVITRLKKGLFNITWYDHMWGTVDLGNYAYRQLKAE